MARKDFDTERRAREQKTRDEREFVLGGESFYAKMAVRPETLSRWNEIDDAMDMDEVLLIADEVIVSLLENVDDTPARYKAVRDSEEDPISLAVLLDVATWLIEVQTGRPIEPPSVSGDLSQTTPESGTNSTDGSSSTAQPEDSETSTSEASATSSTPTTPT